MSRVDIIYASTSGNTQLVCEYVQSYLQEQSVQAHLHRAEVTDVAVFNETDTFILATSTWEHGVVNPHFHKLLKQMQEYDFSGKKALTIGLGDVRYEPIMFAKGIDDIKDVFVGGGGEVVGTSLKLNGEPHEQLDTVVKAWIGNNIANLVNITK